MPYIEYESHHDISSEIPMILKEMRLRSLGRPQNVIINWHTNIEVVYCTGGEGEILYGTKRIPIKKGDIVVVNSEVFHDQITTSSLEFYYLIIDNNFCHQNGIYPEKIQFDDFISSNETEMLFKKIIEANRTFGAYRAAKIRYVVLGFMIHLISEHIVSTQRDTDNANTKRIKDVTNYIKMHFTEKLTLEDVANQTNISKYYLVHEFKRLTGKTVVEYLNMLRCINARSMIKNDFSISSAALSSGFDNLSYFTRTYKKYIGILPSEDKKSNKE